MTKNWLITEKVIAIFEITLSLLLLYISYITLSGYINMVLYSHDNNGDNISIFFLFKNYHLAILSELLTLFSGCFLLFNKKIGWITALTATSNMVISALFFVIDKSDMDFEDYIIASVTFCILTTIFSLLLCKPFREKYSSLKSALITAAIINALFIADKLLL